MPRKAHKRGVKGSYGCKDDKRSNIHIVYKILDYSDFSIYNVIYNITFIGN
jgi:hypothetical protein